ncbi:hypothetical protein K8I61_14395 [bacterium]|nr:hypothetical protein [bacterium]
MSDNKTDADFLVVQFLIPVIDRNGIAYEQSVFMEVREDLENGLGGWTLTSEGPTPGAWRNPDSGKIEHDDSWRYEVGIPRSRLAEFDA